MMFNFDFLSEVSLPVARTLLILAFVVAWLLSLLVSKDYIFRGALTKKKWRDFRYWILLLVVVQVLLYTYF